MPFIPSAVGKLPLGGSLASYTYTYPDTAPNYSSFDAGLTALTDGHLCTRLGGVQLPYYYCRLATDAQGTFASVGTPIVAPTSGWTYDAAYTGAMWNSGTPSVQVDMAAAVRVLRMIIIGYALSSSGVGGPGTIELIVSNASDMSNPMSLISLGPGTPAITDANWLVELIVPPCYAYRYWKLTCDRSNTYLNLNELQVFT